jgi:hypothetical protein
MNIVNPAAGVPAPAPGRLRAHRFRRPETADRIRIFLLPLAALSLVSAAGTAAAPALWGNPLLLIALSPRLPFLMVAAPGTGLGVFVVVGTLRLCLADPFHYRLGRRLAAGPPAGRSRRARRSRWAQLLGHRLARPAVAVAVLLRPNGRHLGLAGAVGLTVPMVAVLDLVGTALYLIGLHGAVAMFR